MLGCLVGLIYIYQEYKASIWLWLTGIIMPVIYMFVYYEAGLYADFGMQIYYTLAAIYGFLYWKFGPKRGGGERFPLHTIHVAWYCPPSLCSSCSGADCILSSSISPTLPSLYGTVSATRSASSDCGRWQRNTSNNGGYGSLLMWNWQASICIRRFLSPQGCMLCTLLLP